LLAVAVSDRLARSIVKPITALATTTRALEQGDLDARVTLAGPPEVREVGYTLNLLADRIGQLLVSEREAIADLSHRLRTPITALRLNAEGLRDPEEAHRITADIDELTKSVDALIRSAREPMSTAASSCDLVKVVRERGAFWKPLAEEQGRELWVTASDGPLWVAVSEDGLEASIDALIGNVFAHTDEGVEFSLSASQQRDRAILYVDDDGKGLQQDSEVRGVSGSGSTGLGLSIVRSTVESAGGVFSLSRSPTGGTRVTFDLPIVRLR
jgi:signal transduction histidine kinase